MTLRVFNGALGDGLFKGGAGQQSLPNYSHREMSSKKWGRTFFTVLHTSARTSRQNVHEATSATGHALWPDRIMTCDKSLAPALKFGSTRRIYSVLATLKAGLDARALSHGDCAPVHCLCAAVTATNLHAPVASPSESAMAR